MTEFKDTMSREEKKKMITELKREQTDLDCLERELFETISAN